MWILSLSTLSKIPPSIDNSGNIIESTSCIESSRSEKTQHIYQTSFIKNLGQLGGDDLQYYCYFEGRLICFSLDKISVIDNTASNAVELIFQNTHRRNITPSNISNHETNYFFGDDDFYVSIPSYYTLTYPEIWDNISLVVTISEKGIQCTYQITESNLIDAIRIQVVKSPDSNYRSDYFDRFTDDIISIDNPSVNVIQSNVLSTDSTQRISCFVEFSYKSRNDANDTIHSPLQFSTFLGGSTYADLDVGNSIVVDYEGYTYVTGQTQAIDFPVNWNLSSRFTSSNCFVTKLNSTGNGLIYSTIIGGDLSDAGSSITIDSERNVYVTGYCHSNDFPIVNGYVSNNTAGEDTFVFKLNSTGNGLVYSSLVCGGVLWPYSGTDDQGLSITVDDFDNAYVTGFTDSPTFPTVNAYDSTYNGDIYARKHDVFIFKLNATGNGLLFSTFIGGDFDDVGESVSIDDEGRVIIVGYTESPDFPTKNALDTTLNGSRDGFVLKLNRDGTRIRFSTYLGGNSTDSSHDVKLGADGNIYVCGQTSSVDFPTTFSFDENYNGGDDSFIVRLDSTGQNIIYSTYFGGSDNDFAYSLVPEIHGYVYIAGSTNSSDIPMKSSFNSSFSGNYDVFVVKLNTSDNSLLYSTYIGGTHHDYGYDIDIDSFGNVFVTGRTASDDFPTVDAFDESLNGYGDCFVFKLGDMSDSDGDLIPDFNETVYGTDRFNQDSDLDSLDDYSELFVYGTSPLTNDTDSDSMSDSWELTHGLNPLDPQDASADLDNDALSNAQEFLHHTDPNNPDSDMDSIPDGWEVMNGFDPLNPLVPLDEFFFYNLPLILGIFFLGAALAGVGIYLSRPYLEKREKTKKERELEDEARKAVDELNRE